MISMKLLFRLPYFHSNIDSDEVLYYVKGNFMSRKGVSEGSILLTLEEFRTVPSLEEPRIQLGPPLQMNAQS